MTERYRIVAVRSVGLMVLSGAYGQQLWTRAKLRKDAKCRACGKDLAKGSIAFLPITNALNRAHRLCEPTCLQ